jgi:hypothetical protein
MFHLFGSFGRGRIIVAEAVVAGPAASRPLRPFPRTPADCLVPQDRRGGAERAWHVFFRQEFVTREHVCLDKDVDELPNALDVNLGLPGLDRESAWRPDCGTARTGARPTVASHRSHIQEASLTFSAPFSSVGGWS